MTIIVIAAALADCSILAGRPSLNSLLIQSQLSRISFQLILIPLPPLKSIQIPAAAEIPCVITLAIAAPATPDGGIGPTPKINSGPNTRIKHTVPITIYIGHITFHIPLLSV